MYSHAIAATAVIEGFGITGDPKLKGPAQKAVDFVVAAQAEDGSWGYVPKKVGDTSILGWQIRALKTAKMIKGLNVPDDAFKHASRFLDKVAGGGKKSTYGYREGPGRPGTSLTAVGLTCRYLIDGWGPHHPGLAEGVRGLLAVWPPSKNRLDLYYYAYATQVVMWFGGDEWTKQWNPAMRDLLVELQVTGQGAGVDGSWNPDRAMIGSHCGRLGTTCMALSVLEVYYRYQPLYKRDEDGLKNLLEVK